MTQYKFKLEQFPHLDNFGVRFRVERVLPEGHEWLVYNYYRDAVGDYECLVGDVDDCDTEEEAAAAWQNEVIANQEANGHVNEHDRWED